MVSLPASNQESEIWPALAETTIVSVRFSGPITGLKSLSTLWAGKLLRSDH